MAVCALWVPECACGVGVRRVGAWVAQSGWPSHVQVAHASSLAVFGCLSPWPRCGCVWPGRMPRWLCWHLPWPRRGCVSQGSVWHWPKAVVRRLALHVQSLARVCGHVTLSWAPCVGTVAAVCRLGMALVHQWLALRFHRCSCVFGMAACSSSFACAPATQRLAPLCLHVCFRPSRSREPEHSADHTPERRACVSCLFRPSL